MDISRITELRDSKKWRELLRTLPEGDTTLSFDTVNNIKVLKATAYDLNSDNTGRRYTFNVNKEAKKAVIHVQIY